MTVFSEAVDLMADGAIDRNLYERAAENLGVPAEEGWSAVQAWFRERGYAFEGHVSIFNEDLKPGVYVLVEDDVYRCIDHPKDYQLLWWADAEGGTRMGFDELALTGCALAQFVWDGKWLWRLKVG